MISSHQDLVLQDYNTIYACITYVYNMCYSHKPMAEILYLGKHSNITYKYNNDL